MRVWQRQPRAAAANAQSRKQLGGEQRVMSGVKARSLFGGGDDLGGREVVALLFSRPVSLAGAALALAS